jgi:hypothetical protein
LPEGLNPGDLLIKGALNLLRRESSNGLVYYNFAILTPYEGEVFHGVFTRLGGVSLPPYDSLNVGEFVGDEERHVEENLRRICGALGISINDLVSAFQVHGSNLKVAGLDDRGRAFPETDALITDAPGIALMLRFADCVPIVLYDPFRSCVGLVHAGWKGTVEGLARKAVIAMMEAYGSRRKDILAGLGPSIGPCCYRIGKDVVEAVQSAFSDWHFPLIRRGDSFYLDLREANRMQLEEVGVERIEVSGICTSCRSEEFFSHRAEGGRTGRFAVVVGLAKSK